MIISRTPYRVSFFGGGCDFPQWFTENPAAILSTTIDKYCYISVRNLPPFFEHKYRIVYSNIELIKEIEDIKHNSVRECLKFLNVQNGIEIHHNGDLPSNSGLGSSSSFTVGLLHALHALKENTVSKHILAHSSIMVERQICGEIGGIQDQIAVSYGGFNKIIFHGNEFSVNPMIIRSRVLEDLQNGLCLFFTGKSRVAEKIEQSKIENLKNNKNLLNDIYNLTQEAEKELTSKNFDLSSFGRLLDEGWGLKRRLSTSVSTSEIDQIYARAKDIGAYGGKLLGAGGGGFLLIAIAPHMLPKLRETLYPLTYVPFKFENSGSRIEVYNP
jgi:D-glycero-alpha-D-manno-heptose-7-phosphate kinase